jgi:glucosyl-3-phosphoglycerate synthase
MRRRGRSGNGCRLAANVVLIGIVCVHPINLSAPGLQSAAGASPHARTDHRPQIRYKSKVHVSYQPWNDLTKDIAEEKPDLVLLDWPAHLDMLGVSPADVLTRPPCDIALVRGPLPAEIRRVLVPMRGGPHAELALRVALSAQPRRSGSAAPDAAASGDSDVPLRGLEQTLRNLPEVKMRGTTTTDPAQTILDQARHADLIVMGATAQPMRSQASLGEVADRILKESTAAVIAVKTRRPMPLPQDEASNSQAISILVDKWFAENTYHADEFKTVDHLVELKHEQGVTISLALPALNEEETVGNVITTIRHALMDKAPLLDEIVLIDSDSTDRTRDIAGNLGVNVFIHQQLLPHLGARRGKGGALEKPACDTRRHCRLDRYGHCQHPSPFVYGVLGPMLVDSKIQFVKGFYRRPLKVGDKLQASGGGRVTELTARPLLNLFYPELSGGVEPLSGEYGGRRTALETLPFYSGYGVETGLLIGMYERFGLSSIAQGDLLERIHHNQSLEALSKMSFAILQTVVHKLEQRYHLAMLEDVNKSMKLIRHKQNTYFLDVEEIAERERPPMIELEEYRDRMRQTKTAAVQDNA